VDLLLNHDKNRKLGSIQEGNLQLFEDNIGLRAICTVTDKEVIEKAKKKQLRGWSFGFYKKKDRWEDTTECFQRRFIEELDLFEVSIVDNTKNPAYVGTSIEMREETEVVTENRCNDFKAIIIDESTKEEKRTEEKPIDYSIYEKEIELLKLKSYK
jgi:HK97 family phage prohead protease